MGLTTDMATFEHSVRDVVRLGSSDQMFRVATRPVVTVVKHDSPMVSTITMVRYFTVLDGVCDTVRQDFFLLRCEPECSIPIDHRSSCPWPTRIATTAAIDF